MFKKALLVNILMTSVLAFECPKGFLCGTGCGLHESEADASARAQIGKMFKTKVTSSFTTIRSTIGELDESYVHEAINENVVENLEGVIIKAREEDAEEVCAQAVLNKVLFTERMRSKINKFLKESKALQASGKRLVWEKIRDNNKEVAHLGSLLSAVDIDTSSDIMVPPKFSLFQADIKEKIDDGLEDIQKLVKARMVRNGVVQGKNTKVSMDINLNIEKASLNVPGFEKYTLSYDISTKKGGQKLGRAYGKISSHARNKKKVLELIYSKLEKQIPEIFLDIGI